jgi:hypothetical protein
MKQVGSEVKFLRPCPAIFEAERMLLTTRSRRVQEILRTAPQRQAEIREQARRKVNPYRPAWEILSDGAWAGEPCFLLGGGPSLTGFDFERLHGRGRVIAINRAFEFAPFADVLFFMDHKFYRICHDIPERFAKWQAFKGHKIFLNLIGRKLEDVYSVRSLGRHGCSLSLKAGLFHGNNSGLGALAFALAMGARPIYLLGYDMRHENGRAHFHDGYGVTQPERVSQSFIKDFEMFERERRGRGEIINLNPRSGLRMFPFSTIDEVLNGSARKDLGNDGHAIRESVFLGAPATN